MNQCYGCNTCKSADKPLEGFIRSLPMETSHHRVEGQSTKCGFGLQGVCCRLCSNGPCRITPNAPRGICGADADTIVTRNFLRAVASGSGCYIHIVENTALNLEENRPDQRRIKGSEISGASGGDIWNYRRRCLCKSRKSGRCRTCRSVQTGICFCRTD